LRLHFQEKGDAVISDDRTFLNLLVRYNQKGESKSVAFMTPANVIVAMADKEIITADKAKRGLNKIKDLIRDSSYQTALEELKGGGD